MLLASAAVAAAAGMRSDQTNQRIDKIFRRLSLLISSRHTRSSPCMGRPHATTPPQYLQQIARNLFQLEMCGSAYNAARPA